MLDIDEPSSRFASCKNAACADLIVFLGYGDELPVFGRARALWEFYLSNFPGIQAIFVRTTHKLPRGEICSNGYDLLIGSGDINSTDDSLPGYRNSGIWSARENADVIFRQISVYDYLLRKYRHPFFLYNATITSVVDFRGLLTALQSLPTKGCFAGSPGRLTAGGTNPSHLGGLTFVSGANTLFSSDMLAVLRDRYDPLSPDTQLPNDVWQALMLQDVQRIPLPIFSFVKPGYSKSISNTVTSLTQLLVRNGHYHFRVKTTSQENGVGLREEIDPWIMLRVMEGILEAEPRPGVTDALIRKLLISVAPVDGVALSAFNEDRFFTGPRSFPVTDIEAEIIFSESL